MAWLHLCTLGPPRILLGDRPVVGFESDKARALLVYLAVEADRPHSRERLADLLWPDLPHPRARQNLSQALFNLRHTVDDYATVPPFFLITRDHIQFNSDSDHWLDLTAFVRSLATDTADPARLEAAMALYRGPFLGNSTLVDTVTFEEWVLVWRERCHCLAVDALLRLVAVWEADERAEQAILAARRLVELEPWHEEAYRHLMTLLARTGRRSEALAQYERCRRLLAEELDVGPSVETIRLYEQIRDDLEIANMPAGKPTLQMQPEPSTALPPFLTSGENIEPAPPLCVARERELAQLHDVAARTLHDLRPRVVFVAGEAGQGKTSLLQAFGRRAAEAQPRFLVAGGACNAYTGIGDPYLPFRQILARLTGDLDLDWSAGNLSGQQARRLWWDLPLVARTLVQHGPDLVETLIPGRALLERAERWHAAGGVEPSLWLGKLQQLVARRARPPAQSGPLQQDLFEQVARVLWALAQERPLLLMLDDLQWADFGSISLLHHIGQRVTDGQLMIVGAYRPEELEQPASGRRHPLTVLLHEFQRRFGEPTLLLGREPDRRFVDELLDSEPNDLDGDFRSLLFAQTAGHPLYTVELVRSMQEQGALVQDDTGRWVKSGPVDWTALPPKVEGAIAARIASLPEGWQALLAAASVQGTEFVAEVAIDILGADQQTGAQLLRQNLGAQLHLVDAQRRIYLEASDHWLSFFRFRHILFQRYCYQRLDAVERSALHGATGAALEARYGSQTDDAAVVLARHFEEAGHLSKAVDYLHRAGNRALRMAAPGEAMTHLRSALSLLASQPDTRERVDQELALQLALGAALIVGRGYAAGEVADVFARAETLAGQVDKTTELFLALWNLKSFYDVGADYDPALILGKRLLRIAHRSDDDALRMAAHMSVGGTYTFAGRLVPARRHLETSLRLYDCRKHAFLGKYHGQDPGVTALSWAAIALWILGYTRRALAYSRQALALARRLDQPYTLTYALVTSCILQQIVGNPVRVGARAELAIHLAEEHGYPLWLEVARQFHIWAMASTGRQRPVDAIARYRRSLVDFRATGARIGQSSHLCMLADLYAYAGQIEDALAVIEEAVAVCRERDERYFEPELYRRQGDLYLEGGVGQEEKAEAGYRQAIEVALELEMKFWALRATVSLARLEQERGRPIAARRQLAGIYACFSEESDSPDLEAARTLLAEIDANGPEKGAQSPSVDVDPGH